MNPQIGQDYAVGSQLDHYTLEKFPHLYDQVHDVYGHGGYVAWVLVAYTTAAHIIINAYPGVDTVKRDFLMTLAYPTLIAGHLIVQVQHYPGPKQEIWTTLDGKYVPYAAAIWASEAVCRLALGMNLWGMILALNAAYETPKDAYADWEDSEPNWPVKRLGLLTASSLWILIALCVPGGRLGVAVASVAGTFILIAFATFVIGILLFTSLGLLVSTGYTVASIGKSTLGTTFKRVGWIAFELVMVALVASISFGVLGIWYNTLFPKSKHSVTDLGQASALFLFGGINVAFSLRHVVKEHGPKMWTRFYRDVEASLNF